MLPAAWRWFCISIHAPLAGCDLPGPERLRRGREISIHAPLAGCDRGCSRRGSGRCDFNPRTPCGVRLCFEPLPSMHMEFQSTHPLRGATMVDLLRFDGINISIHAPLAGCDLFLDGDDLAALVISIHAPLAGCDLQKDFDVLVIHGFQSTHPLRGATHERHRQHAAEHISIHAPLAGCDRRASPRPTARSYFNPRTPCGVRQRKCTKFSAHFAITDNSIGFPRPECRLLGHFLLIPGACSARERVRTFL